VQLFPSLRRAFRWHRRTFAALLIAVAVLAALNSLTARSGAGVPVVVAARSISGGARVQADDLAVVRAPPDLVADGAFDSVEAVVGRTAVVDVPVRAALTPSTLLGGEGQVAPGRLALPVRFGEAGSVSLLRVGSRIDVLGPTTEGRYGIVASGVRVVALPSAGETGLLADNQSPLVLLEVSSSEASQITAAAAVSSLSFALH